MSFKTKAFSLMELVLVVALLSVGILGVFKAFSSSARAAALSCDMVSAVFLAEEIIEEVEFNVSRQPHAEQPRTASGERGRFSWEYLFYPSDSFPLKALNVSVQWRRRNKDEALTFDTVLNS